MKGAFETPRCVKTGTTIAGCIFKVVFDSLSLVEFLASLRIVQNGVILGADTRATAGTIVEDPNCAKIHYMAPNIYCCGAGVAADCDYITRLVSNQLVLHRLYTGRNIRVVTVATILKQRLYK